MPRQRKPERDKARWLWDESEGTKSPSDIAQELNIKVEQVRKWKSLDKWIAYKKEKTKEEQKKRGGQKGNTNAKEHGAPKGNANAKEHGAPKENRNAETHGAYTTIKFKNLSTEEKEYILNLGIDVEKNLAAELQILRAKEVDLERRIQNLHEDSKTTLYVERVVTVYGEEATTTTTTSASTFEQVQKLEVVLGRVQGRIIKLIDSIKAHESEVRRADLEHKRYNLHRQKLSGVFDIDPATGLIDDSTDEDDTNPEDKED